MADNSIVIQGKPVSTDDRNGIQMQRVLDGDSVLATVTKLTVPPGGTFLAAADVNTRRQAAIVNSGAVNLEMYPGGTFVYGNGFPLAAGDSFSTNYSGTIWFIPTAGTAEVRIWGES